MEGHLYFAHGVNIWRRSFRFKADWVASLVIEEVHDDCARLAKKEKLKLFVLSVDDVFLDDQTPRFKIHHVVIPDKHARYCKHIHHI
jgi:hypothetical protein